MLFVYQIRTRKATGGSLCSGLGVRDYFREINRSLEFWRVWFCPRVALRGVPTNRASTDLHTHFASWRATRLSTP